VSIFAVELSLDCALFLQDLLKLCSLLERTIYLYAISGKSHMVLQIVARKKDYNPHASSYSYPDLSTARVQLLVQGIGGWADIRALLICPEFQK